MDEEPVEILVRLAESGEIDPWNIDIVEVTDRFLQELDRMQKLDLRVSGRTLFFASTLLRMKSEYLEEPEPQPEDEAELFLDDYSIEDDVFSFGEFTEPVERLEREIQRRLKRKDQRKRPVTLYELIKDLKTAEKLFRRRQRRKGDTQPEFFFEAEDIVGVAHEEDFSDAASSVYSSFENLSKKRKKVTLSDICTDMKKDLRSVYLPLLFLMLEGKLILEQEEFFGEITVSEWSSVMPDGSEA
ncbi:segregation/condensation protein A [Methanomicrobium antiquum]|uniref:Segregation/condensation protein A n=1 Tax=Methanomicrobium antiquum TaxID=487686 RepID=A0AAF0JLF7_9EURY|nr:ScpA family protein [Methanomicrobium antiquum]WFN36072.1 segregation/condensation protein A [Methanomicrobium antiquum]